MSIFQTKICFLTAPFHNCVHFCTNRCVGTDKYKEFKNVLVEELYIRRDNVITRFVLTCPTDQFELFIQPTDT